MSGCTAINFTICQSCYQLSTINPLSICLHIFWIWDEFCNSNIYTNYFCFWLFPGPNSAKPAAYSGELHCFDRSLEPPPSSCIQLCVGLFWMCRSLIVGKAFFGVKFLSNCCETLVVFHEESMPRWALGTKHAMGCVSVKRRWFEVAHVFLSCLIVSSSHFSCCHSPIGS